MSPGTEPAGSPASPADLGLLSPVWAGTAAELLTGDEALVRAMVRAESALLRALVTVGIAPAPVAEIALSDVPLDARALALEAVAGGNPVIPLVDRLRETVGAEDDEHAHRGATSQDILDTALVLVASDVLRRMESDLTSLAGYLAGLVSQTRDVPVVARTLTQQALPTTMALRAAGWLAGVHDAVRVVRTCTTLPVSLGGPVGSGAAYGVQAAAVLGAYAEALGQRAPVGSWHTRRTPVIGVATALTVSGAACGKIAADLLVMGQTEVGEAREAAGGPSSSMPHKANPAQSVLVASAARQLPALGSVIGASAVAEQERPAGAWHAEWQPLRTMLRLAGGAAERCAGYLPGVDFDHAAMTANLARLVSAVGQDDGWVSSHTEPAQVWVDRVLAQHEEVFG